MKYTRAERFDVGDLVLKWDKPREEKEKLTKFQPLLIGPFIVDENISHNSFKLKSLDGKIDPFPINGQDLKQYFQ